MSASRVQYRTIYSNIQAEDIVLDFLSDIGSGSLLVAWGYTAGQTPDNTPSVSDSLAHVWTAHPNINTNPYPPRIVGLWWNTNSVPGPCSMTFDVAAGAGTSWDIGFAIAEYTGVKIGEAAKTIVYSEAPVGDEFGSHLLTDDPNTGLFTSPLGPSMAVAVMAYNEFSEFYMDPAPVNWFALLYADIGMFATFVDRLDLPFDTNIVYWPLLSAACNWSILMAVFELAGETMPNPGQSSRGSFDLVPAENSG